MQHFIVCAGLLCWFPSHLNVSHSLHTPDGGDQCDQWHRGIGCAVADWSDRAGLWMAGASVLIATINIVGGFMVTRRMLAMSKS